MLRDLLARVLPRWLAIVLGVRRVTPRGAWDAPRASYQVEEAEDTGGGFRAAWRPQDPSKDPREPGGGESSSAGTDHGWSNCTMSSGAMALAYQRAPSQGSLAPWGGDLRHRQGDLSGGTDLYDVQDAWEEYGEALSIRSGQGWSKVKAAHDEGRAIVVQGQGNVPGSESFTGGHGCVIAPETHSDGRWLFGDPLASGWQWVSASSIRTWMEAWSSGCSFAVGERPPDPPPPTTEPDTGGTPDTTPYSSADLSKARQEGVAQGRQAGGAEALDAVFRSWSPGRPRTPLEPWDGGEWDAGAWGQVPYPLEGLAGARTPAAWGTHPTAWTGALWRDVTPLPGELTPWGDATWSAPWT